jgi:serine/threonine protein kinase
LEEDLDNSIAAEIPFSAIAFQELLHRGTFKTVHRATVSHPPRGMAALEVAVKRLKDDCSELGSQELMAEVYILKAIQDKAGTHPHLVSLVGVTTPPGPPCLLLEFCPHGTLDRLLWALKKGPVPEWYLWHVREVIADLPYHRHVACDLMRVALQVADGMCFLAGHGFVHHDLSTRNVLVGPRLHVKVGNPGMFHEGYYYIVSEREHFLHDMAPECLWEKRFSLFSDVWSFGILMYKLVTLETNPYPGVPPRALYNHLVARGQRPRLLSSFSNELYFLLQRCWQAVPTERPTFPLLLSELRTFSSSPTRHIILRTSKDELTPGYVSENGQVFLTHVPAYVFRPRLPGRRLSNPVSSADDTVYSRETAESLLFLYSSEVESTYTTRETEEEEEEEGHSQESHDQSCYQEELQGRDGSREKLVYF